MENKYTTQHRDEALAAIEHGGLPSNRLSRELYYELTSLPTHLLPVTGPAPITEEDRVRAAKLWRALRALEVAQGPGGGK